MLQNKAVRHLGGVTRYTRMDNVYLNFRILKLDDLHTFELGKFMYRFKAKTLPNSFSKYFQKLSETRTRVTRSTSRGEYLEIRCCSKKGERSIKWQGSRIWNKLPVELKQHVKTSKKFADNFKNYIFSKM